MFSLSEAVQFLDSTFTPTTMLVTLVVLMLGWMTVKKVVSLAMGMVTGIIRLFPTAYATCGVLALCGLTCAGYGIGELRSGPTTPDVATPLTNKEAMSLATCKDVDPERLVTVLKYIETRDTRQAEKPGSISEKQPTEEQREIASPRSARLGFMALLSGIGMLLVSVVTLVIKLNYHFTD